ncbi:hypothetical protein E0H64_17845 [Rhizobium leguminosarum bv. viciae]|uniref:hypothetical protein n=1 Tax=Rhizobium TaxID=379 RepID=UPI00103B4D1B|nr:hypothetical protein [Rhizobium leguminosarum]TBZ67859.1 hypothetical protein E0H64_17845 [Rhizobium leguminosarum bv. viciae]
MNVMIGVCAILSGCNPFEPQLYSVCEHALQQRLKSPASYKRVDVRYSERPATRHEFLKSIIYVQDSGSRERLISGFDRNPQAKKQYELAITYDAMNSFGAMLRGFATCGFMGESSSDATSLDVTINGETNLDWYRHLLQEQSDK